MSDPVWKVCGHPKTEANIQKVGVDNGVRCRICRNAFKRDLWRRNHPKAPLNQYQGRGE